METKINIHANPDKLQCYPYVPDVQYV